jgi:hypothetical protein
MTRNRERLCLAGLAVALVCGLWAIYRHAISTRREQEAIEENARLVAAASRARVDMQPVVGVTLDFFMGLDREDDDRQPGLTTDAFRARHRGTGGILRLRLPDRMMFGAVDQDGPLFCDRWSGSLAGGELAYRGDVLRDGVVSGSYTIALVRNNATGRWQVDAFTLSE